MSGNVFCSRCGKYHLPAVYFCPKWEPRSLHGFSLEKGPHIPARITKRRIASRKKTKEE